jgi:hypothetical protein
MIRDIIRQEFGPRERFLLPVAGIAIAAMFLFVGSLPGILE